MIKIPLTQNKVALIDNKDSKLVRPFKWCAHKHKAIFYAVTNIQLNNKQITLGMHRLILNAKPREISDHIDMNGLNNQRYNLRKCTKSQNHMNRRSTKNGSSIYKGVSWHKSAKKWRATIILEGKFFHLGCRNSEIECAKLYDKKAQELFGEFARLNFPDCQITPQQKKKEE